MSAYLEAILMESRAFGRTAEKHLQQPINPAFYERTKTALQPFENVFERTKRYPFIYGLPLRANESQLRGNRGLMHYLESACGNSAYFVSKMLGMLYKGTLQDQIGGTHHKELILCTDNASVRTIQHEVFHFVHDQLLQETTRLDIERMFGIAQDCGDLVDKRQINPDEYFAFGGEYFLRKGRIWSPHRKLRKKYPQLHTMIQRVLSGEKELLISPSEGQRHGHE